VGSSYYQVIQPVVSAATTTAPAAYALEADPTGDQVNDTQCATFTLNSVGIQGSKNSAGAANSEPGTCW
jgi:Tfp pilus assembly protein PilE